MDPANKKGGVRPTLIMACTFNRSNTVFYNCLAVYSHTPQYLSFEVVCILIKIHLYLLVLYRL